LFNLNKVIMTLTQAVQSSEDLKASSSTEVAGRPSAAANKAVVDMGTTISSLAELKSKAPEVWFAMMQGIAMNVCQDIERQQDHLKKAMKRMREHS
jgi:hypothetical protein